MYLGVDRRNVCLYNKTRIPDDGCVDSQILRVVKECESYDKVFDRIDDDCVVNLCDELNNNDIETQDDLCKAFVRACNVSDNIDSFLNYTRLTVDVIDRKVYETRRRLDRRLVETTDKTRPWYVVRVLEADLDLGKGISFFASDEASRRCMCVFDPEYFFRLWSVNNPRSKVKLHFALFESDTITVQCGSSRFVADILCKLRGTKTLHPMVHMYKNFAYNDSLFVRKVRERKINLYDDKKEVVAGRHSRHVLPKASASDNEKRGENHLVHRLLQQHRNNRRRGNLRGRGQGIGGLFRQIDRCRVCNARRMRRTEYAMRWRFPTIGYRATASNVRHTQDWCFDRMQIYATLREIFFKHL